MLPLFPHEDTDRARQMIEIIKPLADAFREENDPACEGCPIFDLCDRVGVKTSAK